MRKILASAAIALACFASNAQQDYQFTHYMFDRLSFNPAYAGIEGKFCATGMYRNQWSGGFDNGQPKSFLFNFSLPVPVLHGGVGLSFFSDKLGFQSNTVARLSYSFHQYINNVGTLGGGLSAGIINVAYKPDWISIDDYTLDGAIPDGSVSQTTYDLSLGVYLKGTNYYAGISSTHLTESELASVNFANRRHYHIFGGYDWNTPWVANLQINPSVYVKSDATSTQVDINLRGTWTQMPWAAWGGVGYRVKDAIMPMVGGLFNFVDAQSGKVRGTLRLGYAYDITTSEIKNYSSGSHDIFVSYCFDIVKPPVRTKYKTVRFL